MSGTAPQSPTPTPSDPPLPPAIQRQRDAANRLMEQARQGQPAPDAPGVATDAAEPGIKILVPQADQTPEPPNNVQQPQQPPPQEGQQPPAQDDNWEHKYRSLEGRHRAENQRMQAQIDGFRELIATLQTAPPPAAQTAQTAPVETFSAGPDNDLTDSERQDYGPDLIGVIQKVATRVAYEVAGKLRPEIDKVQGQLGRVSEAAAKTAETSFFDDLSREVSDWRELNTNPEFLTWLGSPDVYSGKTRQQMLSDAVAEKSAARAAAFFQGYKRELQTVSPQGQQPAAPSPAPAPGNGRVPLESLAAPGRAKPGGASTPQEKPVYTRAAVTKFYDDVRRGFFKGREAEMQRLEADIFAATAEGRIT